MRTLRFLALPALALVVGLTIASTATTASILAGPQGGHPVNVNVGFSTQRPLTDLSQDALAAAQKAGRQYLYRLAQEECALLKATIAKTCRLTNLNINTQIQQHNPAQPQLNINGNATFVIGLKEDEGGGG